MSRETRTFTNGRDTTEAYTEDGGKTWRWASNDSYVPLDCLRPYGVPADVDAQTAANHAHVQAFLAKYRKAQRGRKPSAEERFEMRAAFGAGATVVNVITGRRTKV